MTSPVTEKRTVVSGIQVSQASLTSRGLECANEHKPVGRFKKLATILEVFHWLLHYKVFMRDNKGYCLCPIQLSGSGKRLRGPSANVRELS